MSGPSPMPVLLAVALEASVLAAFLTVLFRLVKTPAPARHVLWLLVPLKLLLPPLVHHPMGLSEACTRLTGGLEADPVAMTAPTESSSSKFAGSSVSSEFLELSYTEEPASAELDGPVAGLAEDFEGAEATLSAAARALEAPAAPPIDWLAWLGWSAMGIWGAGSFMLLWRQAWRIGRLHARIRAAEPAPAEVAAECRALLPRLGLLAEPRVKVMPGRSSPLVWAVGWPTIVVPGELCAADRRDVLRHVLAHEMAHLRRGDAWVAWIELFASWLYWWLPALWLARREVRRAADEACDAWAVHALGSRRAYARSLVSAIEWIVHPEPPAPLGRGLGERQEIERRLTVILRGRLSHRMTLIGQLAVLCAALLVLPAAPGLSRAQNAPEDEPADVPSLSEPAAPAEPAPQPTPAARPVVPATPAAPRAAAAAPIAPAPVQPGGLPLPGAPPNPAPVPAPARAPIMMAPRNALAPPANPANLDTERRIQSLERKMDEILRALQDVQGSRANSDATGNQTYGNNRGRFGPPVTVPGTARVGGAGIAGVGRGATVEAGDPKIAPGGYVGKPAPARARPRRAPEPNELPDQFGASVRELDLDPSDRENIDKLDKHFQARMQKLREEQEKAMKDLIREHREGVRKVLREVLSPKEFERIEQTE